MADTLNKIKCPACGKEMEKVFIPSEGINIDICIQGCGGIFFDNKEFKFFNKEKCNLEEIIKKLEGKSFIDVDDNEERLCPACGSKMVKNRAGISDNVKVDDCYVCGGKFLDNHELKQIIEEYENDQEKSAEVIEYMYKKVGKQLQKSNQQYARYNMRKSMLQKIFYSIAKHI